MHLQIIKTCTSGCVHPGLYLGKLYKLNTAHRTWKPQLALLPCT